MAELAALNVKQCKMKHDSCRSTSEFKHAGQNLAYRANSGAFEHVEPLIENVVKGWFKEVSHAALPDMEKCCNSRSGKTIGHFTQLITDRATQVGCAIVKYTEKEWKTSLVCCNYAFSNMVGSKVYVMGKTASGCNSGVNPDYPALCGLSEKIKASL